MKRRTLIAVSGAAALPIIAGCLNNDDDSENDGENETSAPDGETPADESESRALFENAFSATSRGGFLTINENVGSRAEAREAGFQLPDGQEVFTLMADVSDDGSWQSTEAGFPPIQTEISGFPVEANLELPDGLTGVITQDRMTATGTIRVTVENPEGVFSFDIDATTGDSGNLTGEANFEETPLTATLVDNKFTIDEDSGNALIDSQLGLPAEESGTNWFEIELELTGT